MKAAELVVSELFGPTVQGEGPSAGQLAVFVRTAVCNLSCPACDTPYSWDWSRFDRRTQSRRMPVAEVAGWVLSQDAGLVVVTGGEPLLQQPAVADLVNAVSVSGRRVEVETNGTVLASPALVAAGVTYNVSPKLAAFAGDNPAARRRINSEALHAFAANGAARFKFVVTHPDELDEVAALVHRFDLAPVWVMPEGVTPEVQTARLRLLVDHVVARGWNIGIRLHVYAWGDVRGR